MNWSSSLLYKYEQIAPSTGFKAVHATVTFGLTGNAWNQLLAAEDATLNKDTRPLNTWTNLSVFVSYDSFCSTSTNILMSIELALFHIHINPMVREVISCFAVSVTDDEATFKAAFGSGPHLSQPSYARM